MIRLALRLPVLWACRGRAGPPELTADLHSDAASFAALTPGFGFFGGVPFRAGIVDFST